MKKLITLFQILLGVAVLNAADKRPNIVWIVGEDMGPELGCYSDAQAITPNMDRLALDGARFTHCFTHAPVCAPSRSGLITGQYPTSIGTHHMRSKLISPPPMFTSLLRKAGYFVAWPGKTDFNFDVPPDAFDSTADWTRKLPPQPFFAYVNFVDSHESSIRMMDKFKKFTANLKPEERHDPAKMRVPPYHPDTPEVRRDLANYYDLVTAVDHKVGEVLEFLDAQSVTSNTVVFLTGDHGRGLPRSKRWVYDSGIHVPLIVRWQGRIKPGSVREDLVSFIDFAPTVLAIAGISVPIQSKEPLTIPGIKHPTSEIYSPMQGTVFLGPLKQERDYIFAARDRMDETYDRIRTVRTKQFQYVRNFEPQLPYAQRIAYMEEMPTMQVWRRLNAEGRLTSAQKLFFAPTKPREELYDCDADPHEIHNLAGSPGHQAILMELRAALDKWIEETHDLGSVPETELIKRGLVKDVLSTYEERKLK
ncbi:MAG: sulfatase [Verrucomicrobia bacterium]|nr:sulfatase [Verrucomicrobiota bacterium]